MTRARGGLRSLLALAACAALMPMGAMAAEEKDARPDEKPADATNRAVPPRARSTRSCASISRPFAPRRPVCATVRGCRGSSSRSFASSTACCRGPFEGPSRQILRLSYAQWRRAWRCRLRHSRSPGSQFFRIAAAWRAMARHRRICLASSAERRPMQYRQYHWNQPRGSCGQIHPLRRHTDRGWDAFTPK
jgi:hypothetical protein